jgi:hypothetical protein
MVSLVQFMAAMVVALLPRQYRSRWAWASEANLRGPTIFPGLAEAVISLGLIYHPDKALTEKERMALSRERAAMEEERIP